MSAGITRYRAKADCRAGGLFRRAGEEFDLPTLTTVPGHLEAVRKGEAAAVKAENSETAKTPNAPAQKATASKTATRKGPATGKPASVPKEAQVGKADIGAAPPTPVSDVSSADLASR